MKSKIILTTSFSETLVATFKSDVEAFQAAALFQALTNSSEYVYYVEHYVKGKGWRRTQPDSFATMVNNSHHLTELIKSKCSLSLPLYS